MSLTVGVCSAHPGLLGFYYISITLMASIWVNMAGEVMPGLYSVVLQKGHLDKSDTNIFSAGNSGGGSRIFIEGGSVVI